ncbi:MAG: hypothetical protein WCK90_02465, partial [archaeon]
MNKKGQVTIFVIVAVIIVVLAVGGYYFRDSLFASSSNPATVGAENYVKTCLKNATQEAVFAIGQQGGYFDTPAGANNFSVLASPYYMIGSENLVPKKEVVESELSKYVKFSLDRCLGDFSSLKQTGISVKAGVSKVTTTLFNDRVDFALNLPITVSQGDKSFVLSNFKSEVAPVRIPIILAASSEIVASELKNTKSICSNCIDSIAEKYKLNV